MTAATKRKLTPQQYLDIERKAEFRSEFYNGEMFAMAGAKYAHNLVSDNLVRFVGNALNDGPCRTLSRDMRVLVDRTGLYTYPDMIILCGEPEFVPDEELDTLLNPDVIFEILSSTTERYDRGTKFLHYQQIPSLKEYILVSQETPKIERFVKQSDSSWLQTVFLNLDATFEMATIPVKVTMIDIYRDVVFTEPDPMSTERNSTNR